MCYFLSTIAWIKFNDTIESTISVSDMKHTDTKKCSQMQIYDGKSLDNWGYIMTILD